MQRRRRLIALAAVVLLASSSAIPLLQEPANRRFALAWDGQPEGMPLVISSGARYQGLSIRALNADGDVDTSVVGDLAVQGLADDQGQPIASATFAAGVASLPACHRADAIRVDGSAIETRVVGGFWSIIAPLVAIGLAILMKEVLLALLIGCWAGVIAIEGGVLQGSMRLFDRHLISALADSDHVKILVFSCTLGALVAMISRLGGVRAMVEAIAARGRTRGASQVITWFTGVLIFFDDYANALLVGNTMRPVTDRYKVSREKLAYLVDSTSAPVACIAPISTWIVAEVGYINDWLGNHVKSNPEGAAGYTEAYDVFLDSIPYNFYPILALCFGLILVLRGRDFGPMLKAERRAHQTGKLIADGATPLSSTEMDEAEPVDPARLRWWNGAVPILTLVLTVIFGLYFDGIKAVEEPDSLGTFERIRRAFGNANSYNVLLWASAAGLTVAWLLALGQKMMTVKDASETTVRGVKAMMTACLVLILAWTLSGVCGTLNTSGWLIEQVSFSFTWLPAIVFMLAAVIGFSTGSSWSTMAILVPLTMAYAYQLGVADGADVDGLRAVLLSSIGAVLAGAVFGDHCSPISDTTVMSSMAAGCDHMDHVATQLPYALTVGGVAVVLGYLPAGFGVPPLVLLPVSIAALFAIVTFVGKRVES